MTKNRVYTLGLWINISTDGGATSTPIRGKIHADQHGMWIDPDNSNYILAAHDGGISVSYDKGENWRNLIEELPLAQFYNVEYDFHEPFRVYGSVQDHHSFYSEVDSQPGQGQNKAHRMGLYPGSRRKHPCGGSPGTTIPFMHRSFTENWPKQLLRGIRTTWNGYFIPPSPTSPNTGDSGWLLPCSPTTIPISFTMECNTY